MTVLTITTSITIAIQICREYSTLATIRFVLLFLNHLTVDCGRDYVGILYGGLDQAHRRLVVEISPAVDHEQRVLVVQCCLAELGAADELLDQVLQLRVLGRKTLTLLLDRDGIERCLIIFPIEIG